MSPEKKINLLVIPDLFPNYEGDVQGIFVWDYLKSLQPYCNVTVLFMRLTGKKGLQIENKEGVIIYRYCFSDGKIPTFLKPFFYLFWFIKGYSIGKKLKETQIIHSHGTILGGTLSFLLSKKLKVPFVISEHQGPFSMISASFWKRNWAKYIIPKANMLLTVSEHLKNEILAAGIKPRIATVSYNPVDTELFGLRENLLKKNILFVGRLDNFKGALRCVKAFEKIASDFPSWKFTIVGDGEDYFPIKNYIEQQHSLIDKIFLKGKKSKAEIAIEMKNADFLVFPSEHESFGLVVAEALSCGLPVVVTNQTAPKEFVNEASGILVAPNDIEAICTAMVKLINTSKTYNSEAIRAKVIANFGFENFGKKLLLIYKSLLNKQ